MSRGQFVVEGLSQMEATLTFTMTVGEWQKLHEQLQPGKWPSSDLAVAIAEMVHSISKREIWSSKQ